MKKALSAQPYMPYRSVEDNLTFPEEFHFATDDRIKSVPKQEEKRKDFTETLRQHPPSPVRNSCTNRILGSVNPKSLEEKIVTP